MENNLYKKLKFFALCLAIICMVLSLFKKVKAEELPLELQEQIIYILDNDLNIPINQTYLDNCFTCPYCAVYNINNGTHNIYYFDFYFTKNIGYLYERYDGRYYYATSMYFEYTGSNRGYISCSSEYDGTIGTGYRIIVDNTSYYYGSVTAASSNIVHSTNFNITGLPSTYTNIYGYDIYSNSTSSYTYNVLISYGDCYLQNGQNFAIHEDTYTPPATNNTPGFECYKLETKGGIYFYADYSNLITFDYGTTNTSIFSCDIHLDDTVQSISLNSTSEYFQYDVSFREAYYSFPITAFVPNYTDYENVWIDNVKVVNTYSGHGSSYDSTFVYITPVVIQGDAYNDSDLVNPDDVIIPDTDYQPITNMEIAENTYLVEFSNKDGLTFTEFHNVVIPNIYEDNTAWVYMDKSTYSFDDFIEDFLQGSGFDNLVDYITGIHSEDEAIEKMTDYLYDNAFTLTSDMVIFVYINGDWKDSNFTSDDLTYWVYYTASGRLRAISQLLNSSNTNISRQLSISSGYYNYAKSKLNTIDKNLYEFANSQLGFNNSFLNKLSNIDTLLGRIENALNKILDSLKNLHLTQLDTIDSKLSTIIDNMTSSVTGFNEDDTIAEAIAYYQTHTQKQAVLEDKYSVWFTGYCHFWLQEYGEEEPINNTRSSTRSVTDFASSEKRHILFRTFKVITNIYDKMQEDLLFNRVEEMFDYFLDVSSDVSHTRRSYFYDVFNEQNTPTLDYNPYE